jgi:two-component system chemotaxis response regulator CheB
MPLTAMRHLTVDHCLPLTGIAALLTKMASEESGSGEVSLQDMKEERNDLIDPPELLKSPPPNETQISLACPECNGSLYEQKEGDMAHFICHVGHAFSPQSLSEAHKEVLERALWTAVRTLNERVMMHRQFLRRERNGAEEILFKRFQESAAGAERDVELLRDIISRI